MFRNMLFFGNIVLMLGITFVLITVYSVLTPITGLSGGKRRAGCEE